MILWRVKNTEKLAAEMLAVLLKSAELRAWTPVDCKSTTSWIANIVIIIMAPTLPGDISNLGVQEQDQKDLSFKEL